MTCTRCNIGTLTLEVDVVTTSSQNLTLADVLTWIAVAGVFPLRRRSQLSRAVRRVAHLLGQAPEDIPPHVDLVRERLHGPNFPRAGMTRPKFMRMASEVKFAIEATTPRVSRHRVRARLTPEWRVLD